VIEKKVSTTIPYICHPRNVPIYHTDAAIKNAGTILSQYFGLSFAVFHVFHKNTTINPITPPAKVML
jgi:hypothetical protein